MGDQQPPSEAARFDRLVQQLNACRDALERYPDPSIRAPTTGDVGVEPPPDERRQVVRDATQVIVELNAARHDVSPRQVRAYYEAAAGYAKALQRHTNNQDYVNRTLRAAESGLRALDEWERKRGAR